MSRDLLYFGIAVLFNKRLMNKIFNINNDIALDILVTDDVKTACGSRNSPSGDGGKVTEDILITNDATTLHYT